jgi:hypothetical protein
MSADFFHDILIDGNGRQSCSNRVLHFLHQNLLVRYARVEVNSDISVPATAPDFWSRVDMAVEVNNRTVSELLSELQNEGFADIEGLQKMEQGYQSKLFHTLAHLLDGFFGIDSFFYNLVEDSNRISAGVRQQIREEPEKFWLVRVECWGSSESADRLTALRETGKIKM